MNQEPRIACIETSSRVGTVAVAAGSRCLQERTFRADFNHATELLPTLNALCEEQDWAPQSLDHLYLSIGPGSFTGLRIAVTVARTLAWSARTRTVAVPTLDVIAQNALDHESAPSRVGVVLDAKRGQIYGAAFELHEGRYRQILEPDVWNPADFCGRIDPPRVLMGEGLPHHDTGLNAVDHERLPPSMWCPRAGWVHRLGWEQAQRGEFTDPGALTPVYLRLPEAEEVWRARHES